MSNSRDNELNLGEMSESEERRFLEKIEKMSVEDNKRAAALRQGLDQIRAELEEKKRELERNQGQMSNHNDQINRRPNNLASSSDLYQHPNKSGKPQDIAPESKPKKGNRGGCNIL